MRASRPTAPLYSRSRGYGQQKTKGMRPLPVRPLPALLVLLALGNFAGALVPGGFRRARFVRRGVVLSVVAAYAWLVV
jgi:hypothetical protein